MPEIEQNIRKRNSVESLDVNMGNSQEFITFWSQYYDEGRYPDSIYAEHLNKGGLLRDGDIEPLFEWKHGRPLPINLKNCVNEVRKNLDELNKFRNREIDYEKFWEEFACSIFKSGLTLKVFLLHIARPDDYPISDVNVLRAYWYWKTGRIEDPKRRRETYEEYESFFFKLCEKSKKDPRDVDKAWMSYGKMLEYKLEHGNFPDEVQKRMKEFVG